MAQEGISTLPQSPENTQMPFEETLNASKQAINEQFPGEIPAYDQSMDQVIQQLNMPLEELLALKQVLEFLLQNENQYPQLRERLINEAGVSAEDIPEEFDRGYLTTMLIVVQEAISRQQGQGMGSSMPEPQGFNQGGLAAAAESLRQKGRGGDTILAHINPEEARLLKAMGGSGTINPATGLLEFKGGPLKAVGNAFKSVGNAVKSFVGSPVGRIVATVALTAALGPGAFGIAGLGLNTAVAAGLAGTAVSLAGGSNLKQALISGATSGALAGVSPFISNALPGAGGFLNTAATGAIMGAGYGAATGQNIAQSALTGGVLAGASGYLQGQPAFGAPSTTPAPIIDKSTLYGTNTPVTSGAVLPADGISTLPTGQTNVSVPDTSFSQGMAEYGGGAPQTSMPAPAPTPTPTPSPVADTSFSQGMAEYGGGVSQPATSPQTQSSGIGSYLGKAKDYLFSSDPKNPGFFYNDKGQISVPAVTGTLLAGGYLAGGFNQSQPAPPGIVDRSVTGQTLVNQNPTQYITQNIPGYNAPATQPPASGVVPSPQYGASATQPYQPFTYPVMQRASSPLPMQPGALPYNANPYIRYAANGGISNIYPRKTGKIEGPGTETSDSIPAMLSDGEFVITAKAVRGAGNGSRREGAKKLYRMMHALEKKAGGKI